MPASDGESTRRAGGAPWAPVASDVDVGTRETALCLSTDEPRARAIDRRDSGATERATERERSAELTTATVTDERRVRESAPEKCSMRIACHAHLL